MLFSELVNAELENELKSVVDNLLSLKMQIPELGENGHIKDLNEYIEQNLESLKIEIDSLPSERKTGWEDLNMLFLDILK